MPLRSCKLDSGARVCIALGVGSGQCWMRLARAQKTHGCHVVPAPCGAPRCATGFLPRIMDHRAAGSICIRASTLSNPFRANALPSTLGIQADHVRDADGGSVQTPEALSPCDECLCQVRCAGWLPLAHLHAPAVLPRKLAFLRMVGTGGEGREGGRGGGRDADAYPCTGNPCGITRLTNLPHCRECFARMNVLDPELRLRLAQWLAYHLSNFEYVWPWQKWQHVLDAPPFDGQRCALPRM